MFKERRKKYIKKNAKNNALIPTKRKQIMLIFLRCQLNEKIKAKIFQKT